MEQIHATDTEVWAIANDDADKLRAFRDSDGIGFPLLLDPGAETIHRYGISNDSDDRDIPHPATMVIDKAGTVRFLRIDVNYRERPAVEELLEVLRSL